jgi:carbamoylphosphate synthase large subunit
MLSILPACLLACPACLLQSSHKLQVVVVCEEPLSCITYLARAVQVEPLSAEVAGQMVQQAQVNVKEVGSQTIVCTACIFCICYVFCIFFEP